MEDLRGRLAALRLKPDDLARAMQLSFAMAQLAGRSDIEGG
jgi:hypothetical protein